MRRGESGGDGVRGASLGRRAFVRGAVAAGAALLGPRATRAAGRRSAPLLPPPEASGIEHVVVVMMENRSFDHLLGWHPNADGRQAGLAYADADGIVHPTFPLAPDFTGCGHPNPDHSYAGGREQYADGAMDGFLRSGASDEFTVGYYEEDDRPILAALARHFTTCDRAFCSILAPTFPNRLFLHCARTDRLDDQIRLTRLPTIWDRLAGAGVSARYYFSNVPFLALWGRRYVPISRSYDQFLADAAAGALPAVAFVEPRFTLGDAMPGNDDHPHADVRAGDAFLYRTFRALAEGSGWPGTVLVVTYDEWGGFFDHVSPPRAPVSGLVDTDLSRGQALLGFRVPTIVASPFARGAPADPRVASQVLDHTSVLKLIEWRWTLAPLSRRDASPVIGNLAGVLDFDHPDPSVPDLPEPPTPGAQCPATESARVGRATPAEDQDRPWGSLARSPLVKGWPLGLG